MTSSPRALSLAALAAAALAAPRFAAADTPKPAPPPASKPAPPAGNPVPAPPPARPASYQISAIRAFLYYHETGTFDDRDAATGQMALWNTVIGEGEAKAPSDTTLLQVELTGPSFANIAGALEIVAAAGKRKLVRQKLDAGAFYSGKAQRVLVPVLVYGTGCEEILVTVSFTAPDRKKLKKSATVPFACGE